MTSVRFLPVAEQYPSKTDTSSESTSTRSSVIDITQPKKTPVQPEGQTGKARVSHRRMETTLVASGGFLGLTALCFANAVTKNRKLGIKNRRTGFCRTRANAPDSWLRAVDLCRNACVVHSECGKVINDLFYGIHAVTIRE